MVSERGGVQDRQQGMGQDLAGRKRWEVIEKKAVTGLLKLPGDGSECSNSQRIFVL